MNTKNGKISKFMIETTENIGYKKSPIWLYVSKIPENLCDIIVNEFKKEQLELAGVGKDNNIDLNIRNVRSAMVPRTHWVNGIPMYFGFDANFENFKYDVSDVAFTEFFCYETGMFYRPHIDVNPYTNHPAHRRKLTVIIQLSDENDYEGGELQIYNSNLKPISIPKNKGTIVVFNSSIPHSVKKIKKGTRYALAAWIVGKPFS